MVNLPNNKRATWRWIVRRRDDGRYIVRNPKIGVLIREFSLKRDADFGPETLLPIGASARQTRGTRRFRRSRKRRGTRKN